MPPRGRHKAAREPPHARRVDSHATCGVVAPSCVPSSRFSERARRQQRRWTEAGRGPSPPGVTPKRASRRLFERASWFTFLRQMLLEKSAAFSVGKAHPSAQDCYPVRSTHTHTHTHMNTCEHMCTRACEHTRICTCAHMLTRKHMCTHAHPQAHNACTHTSLHTQSHTHCWPRSLSWASGAPSPHAHAACLRQALPPPPVCPRVECFSRGEHVFGAQVFSYLSRQIIPHNWNV